MKRNMSRTLDKIYRLVKEKKSVDVVAFCNLMDLSPSTFYNYRQFLLDRYENIIYEDGSLKWIETEDCEIDDTSTNEDKSMGDANDKT